MSGRVEDDIRIDRFHKTWNAADVDIDEKDAIDEDEDKDDIV